MIRIHNSVQTSRPPEEVFDYLTDLKNLSHWQANVSLARPLSEGLMRVGFEFEQTLQMGPRRVRGVCTLTDFETNERFAFSMKSTGPIDCDAHFDLESVPGGTRLTLNGEAHIKGFWRLLRPMLATGLRRETRRELETLKRLLESEVSMHAR